MFDQIGRVDLWLSTTFLIIHQLQQASSDKSCLYLLQWRSALEQAGSESLRVSVTGWLSGLASLADLLLFLLGKLDLQGSDVLLQAAQVGGTGDSGEVLVLIIDANLKIEVLTGRYHHPGPSTTRG